MRAAVRAHPPRGKFLQVAGVRLHYLDTGFGVPVVLLHGLGSMVEDFELSGLVSRASEEFRVLAFDRPGYGYSTRPLDRPWTPRAQALVLRAALDELGIARPIVLGHSFGTQVALAYALEFPDQVRGIVLASGYYYPSVRPDALVLAPPGIPLIGPLLSRTLSPIMGRALWPVWLKLIFAPLPVPGYFSRFPTWRALSPLQLRSVGEESAMLLPLTFWMKKKYRELRVPTVIVAGNRDRYIGMEGHSRRLHRELPGSEFVPVLGAGHMVHHANPEAMVRALLSLRER